MHRPAGSEASTAATSHIGVADRIRVGDDWPHIINVGSEDFGSYHRLSGARAADINRTDDNAYAAVGVNIHCRRRLQADVEPETGRHPAPAIRSFKLGLIVRAIFDRLDRLDKANALEGRSDYL